MFQSKSYSPEPLSRYSAKQMRKPVNFVCAAPTAKQVFVVGDFNQWDAKANPMRRPAGRGVDRPIAIDPRAPSIPVPRGRPAGA